MKRCGECGHEAARIERKSFGVTFPRVAAEIRSIWSGRGVRSPDRHLRTAPTEQPTSAASWVSVMECAAMKSERVMRPIVPRFGELCQAKPPQHGEFLALGFVQTCPAMGNNLRKLRELRNWTQQQAADALGYSKGGYLKIERSERELKLPIIEKAAEVYGVSTTEVYTAEVPLVGYVGAGAEMHYYADGDNPDDFVPMVPGGGANTVAVQIRGTSLGSIFETWLVYYDQVRDPPSYDMLGKLCVVGLEDGRVLVKKLRRGSSAGLYHLESNTEGTIEDVGVQWAAKVKIMTPR